MIGLLPLPGAPAFRGSFQEILDCALADLAAYRQAGVDAVLLENSADLPYIKPPLPDADIDCVRQIAGEVRRGFKGPVGLQLLEAANLQALEVAVQTGLDFLRVEGFVFAHIGGAGLIEGCAGQLLRLRRQREAGHIRIFADVRKKHCAHALTGDLPLTEHVRQAEFFQADGLVVTGPRTGSEPKIADLEATAFVSKLPRLIGSGMTPDNLTRFFPHADGFIVGSALREAGRFLGPLDPDRLDRFMQVFRRLKSEAGGG